jgi:hypothetical protein
MSDNTIIQQGQFFSAGVAATIPLRAGVDWMRVYNTTVASNGQTTPVGVEYYWQRGFDAGFSWQYKKAGSANAGANLVAYISGNGFTYFDSSLISYGVIMNTITAVSTASVPVVTNSGTNGIIAGQVVRLFNIGVAKQLSSIDFSVGGNTLSSTTFSLDYAAQLNIAGTTGSFMVVNSSPIFYPPSRYISTATPSGNSTIFELTVAHNYQVGQSVRLNFGAAYGAWSQLNGVLGNITSFQNTYPNNTITVDVNSSSLGAYPSSSTLSAAYPFTYASVAPVGEDTALALSDNLNILSDATNNTGQIGMILGAGTTGPAGSFGDNIFWVAGKSFSVNNSGIFA